MKVKCNFPGCKKLLELPPWNIIPGSIQCLEHPGRATFTERGYFVRHSNTDDCFGTESLIDKFLVQLNAVKESQKSQITDDDIKELETLKVKLDTIKASSQVRSIVSRLLATSERHQDERLQLVERSLLQELVDALEIP